MKDVISVAAESIAREKTRHIVNAAATGTSGTVVATGSVLADVVGWLPTVGVLCGICVSLALFYKTYLEIKLAKIEISEKGRRSGDK